MLDANATAGSDTIIFNIPGAGIHTIDLLIGLPEITDPVLIDGTTQPGYSGTPLIELNGAAVSGGNGYGFAIKAGGSTIRGLATGRFSAAERCCLNNEDFILVLILSALLRISACSVRYRFKHE